MSDLLEMITRLAAGEEEIPSNFSQFKSKEEEKVSSFKKGELRGISPAESSKTEDWPVAAFKDDVLACESPYVILEAETGSGKTVLTPQWFAEKGYRVLVTEPLIETVLGTSEYVAELLGVPLGGYVGYATGEAKKYSPETRILFCTDGLALVRELARQNAFDVLILDELHEWNTNQSTLEAWVWKHIQDGSSPFKKVVALSATMDSTGLAAARGNAPVFKVPGRQFKIERRPAGESIEADVKALVEEGHDVLVFQPGWAEIQKSIAALQELEAEILPFHGGKLNREEKNRAFRSYEKPKVVVSTNSLETGRTLVPSPGRQLAVVSSGLEKRIETLDGVESLILAPVPLSKEEQRAGRTGRVGKGIFISHCPTGAKRSQYPEPEIRRTRPDQTVLRLAVAGYDVEELPFFHPLKKADVKEAKESLANLGFMKDGQATKRGVMAARMGRVSVNDAAMALEGAKRGVFDDSLTIAAIKNTGSLRAREGGWQGLTQEKESDLLVELDLYNAASRMTSAEMRESGIFAPNYFKARDLKKRLVETLRGRVQIKNGGSREDLLKAIAAGMVDHLYQRGSCGRYGYEYSDGKGDYRQLDRFTTVQNDPQWVVGKPFGKEVSTRRGGTQILNLIQWVTKVDPAWLVEVAPHLAEEKKGLDPRYCPEKDTVVSKTQLFFDGQLVRQEEVADPENSAAADIFAAWLAAKMV